jgi:hypothetical protein
MTMYSGTITNCSGAGLYVNSGGSTYLEGTLVEFNFIGVDMEADPNSNDPYTWPLVYLNDNSGTAPFTETTVQCSSYAENNGLTPGVDVLNASNGFVNADYVNWDHWYQPNGDTNALWHTDEFTCDSTFVCSCQSLDSSFNTGCVNVAGGDGMDYAQIVPSMASSNFGNRTQSDGDSSGGCN